MQDIELTIKKLAKFVCPATRRSFSSEKAALESAQKALEAQRQLELHHRELKLKHEENLKKINWLRLNLENIFDLPVLIKQKAKEFWDIDADLSFNFLSFGNISNYHNCPLDGVTNWYRKADLPDSYLGWNGRVVGNVCDKNFHKDSYSSAFSYIFNNHKGFSCFYFTGGCEGTVNKHEIDIGFVFFLNDFPKLKEKYKLYAKEKQKIDDYIINRENIVKECEAAALKSKPILEIDEKIRELTKERELLFEQFYAANKLKFNIEKPEEVFKNVEQLKVNFS